MRVEVTIGPGLDQYASRLRGVRPRQAMAEGVNEGGDLQRTASRRELVDQTGVLRKGDITRRTGSKRASAGSLEYQIKGEGKGMPIRAFPVSVGAHVSAQPWRVKHDFGPRSFRSRVKGLLRRRVGAARMPIEGFNGPAVSKEIVKDRTADEFQANAAPRVERCVLKRLGRMLP